MWCNCHSIRYDRSKKVVRHTNLYYSALFIIYGSSSAGVTQDTVGHHSRFAVFSRQITERLVQEKRLIDPTKAPKQQTQGNGNPLNGLSSCKQAVQAVAKALDMSELKRGVDYDCYIVPAGPPVVYAIRSSCAHIFFRCSDFEGIVSQFWWETDGGTQTKQTKPKKKKRKRRREEKS